MIFRYFRPLRWDSRKGVYQPLKNGGIAFGFVNSASGVDVCYKLVQLSEPFNRDELRASLLHSETNFSLPIEKIGLTDEMTESIITYIDAAKGETKFQPLAKLMKRVVELNDAERRRVREKMHHYAELHETFVNQIYHSKD